MAERYVSASAGRRLLLALAVALALVVVVSGCGLRAERSARPIDSRNLPPDLRVPPAATPSTAGGAVTVYLLAEKRLTGVERRVEADDELAAVLEVLAEGPTRAEQELGISSALPPGQVAAVDVARGTATVDLEPTFSDLRTAEQVPALAQVVFTLTGRPGIGRVAFTLDGESIEVPRGDGALTTDPLAREDFRSFAPSG